MMHDSWGTMLRMGTGAFLLRIVWMRLRVVLASLLNVADRLADIKHC
jgi:hypothetical protein